MSLFDALSYIEGAPPKHTSEHALIDSLLEEELAASTHQETPTELAERVERLRSLLLPPSTGRDSVRLQPPPSGSAASPLWRGEFVAQQPSEAFLETLCEKSPLIRAEFERREKDGAAEEKFDLTRYQRLERGEDETVKDLATRVELMREYTSARLTNLELLANPGVGGMRGFLHLKKSAESVRTWLEEKVKAETEVQDSANQRRKIAQLQCGNAMAEKKRVAERYGKENKELEEAELTLKRAEVDRLKRMAKKRKIEGWEKIEEKIRAARA